MDCWGRREKFDDARAEQKWDYINLQDFKSTSCFTPLSYGVLYIALIISVAVYGIDTFTAANLLFFDRWSGQVKPVIPFNISRWIFAACILLSWILLVYRWIRAVKAIQSGIVAASYLDPLAVRIQSVRVGATGRGWRRFLVFAELTKGRKGTEYVALFTYFSFEAWLRILFAEGPRQVINALTLYSVMEANLVPVGEHAARNGHSPIAQFFVNISILANHNKEQVVVLLGMLFTLVVWIVSAVSLAMAVLFYVLFLWHHIPDSDGGLSSFCRRKVDSRLQKIVGVKVNKALAKKSRMKLRDGTQAVKIGEPPLQVMRQATLPVLGTKAEDKLPEMPSPPMTRAESLRESRHFHHKPPFLYHGPDREPRIPNISPVSGRPIPPSRSATQSSGNSQASYASNFPLAGGAAEMGYSHPPRNFSSTTSATFRTDPRDSNAPNMSPNYEEFARNLQSTRSTHQLALGRSVPSKMQARLPGSQDIEMSGFRSPSLSRPQPSNQYFPPSSDSKSYGITNPLRRSTGPLEAYKTSVPGLEPNSQALIENMTTLRAMPSQDDYVAYKPDLPSTQTRPIPTGHEAAASHPILSRNFTSWARPTRQYNELPPFRVPPPRSRTMPPTLP